MTALSKLLLILISLLLISCEKDDSRLAEVTGIQSQKQIEEENKNLALKAETMELELKKRVDFYEALVGDYQGEVNILGQKSFIELSIQPKNMPAPTDRTRTLDEISYDLNQISLDILLKHYTPNSEVPAIFCKMLLVKPDIKSGQLYLASSDCPNFYQFGVSDSPSVETPNQISEYSSALYSDNEHNVISYLKGYVNPGPTPGKFSLFLKRNENL